MTSQLLRATFFCLAPCAVIAQAASSLPIRVNPGTVTVNAQGATTAFLTFTGLADYLPVDAAWCGTVISAEPDLGVRCDPATTAAQSRLPVNRGTMQSGVFSEAMSVSTALARQAYQATAAGQIPGAFFYVRHFVSGTVGKLVRPDQYVAVILRLSGGGAGAPFALTDVTLRADVETPVLFVRTGETPPALRADLMFSGTGRLRGRWEIVLPGESWPSAHDLLTEASLPPDERGLQRRYTTLERFDVFLPPTGRFTLPGPHPTRLPTSVDGTYLVLLRIEASADESGGTRFGTDTGASPTHNGATAGFAMPTLRYVVGATGSALAATQSRRRLGLVSPQAGAEIKSDAALTVHWNEERDATSYRVEVARAADGKVVFSAVVAPGATTYEVPPFVRADLPDGKARWRVIAVDALARDVRRSDWRSVLFAR